jgi:regulatory protein RepA
MTDQDRWRPVSIATAARDAVPPLDFCLPNLLAGTVGVVAAPAGVGKTSLLLQLGAAVAAGVPVAGELLPAPATTGRVVFLGTEDPPAIMHRRVHFLVRSLAHSGAPAEALARLESRLTLYDVSAAAPVVLMKDTLGNSGLKRLEVLATGTRLLILDPIRSFHYCDEQDYGRMAMLFTVLTHVATHTGCTILFSHHVAQPATDAGLDEPAGALGSYAFVNATRWVLNLSGMSRGEAQRLGVAADERRHYVRASFTKSNYGPPIPARWLRRSKEFEGVFETCAPDGSAPNR